MSAASGRGVFDGNVKVNRLAQKTDAQQLSRNLLLVPRAQVNVKPNLQVGRGLCGRRGLLLMMLMRSCTGVGAPLVLRICWRWSGCAPPSNPDQ